MAGAGMPFAAADQMLVFASYARKDTWRPALVGFISIIIYSMTALLLLGRLGLLSLMVADAVKHVVHTLIMLWVLRRQLGDLGGNPVFLSAIKSLAAALLTGLAAFGTAGGRPTGRRAAGHTPGAGARRWDCRRFGLHGGCFCA